MSVHKMRSIWMMVLNVYCSFSWTHAAQPRHYGDTGSLEGGNVDENNFCKRAEEIDHLRIQEEGGWYDSEKFAQISMPADYSDEKGGFAYAFDDAICNMYEGSRTCVLGKSRGNEEVEKGLAVTTASDVLRQASDERCDWRIKPIAYIRGHICGSYYKILNVDRNESLDEVELKKAFTATVKAVEPYIHNVESAMEAYKYIYVAFECLSDDTCREEYNKMLDRQAVAIAQGRKQLKDDVQEIALHVMKRTGSCIFMSSSILYEWGINLWELADRWEIRIPEVGVIPMGKFLIASILFIKGQVLLKLHGLNWLIVRINQEARYFISDKVSNFQEREM